MEAAGIQVNNISYAVLLVWLDCQVRELEVIAHISVSILLSSDVFLVSSNVFSCCDLLNWARW